jgi:hypothetical protein
VTGPLNWLGWRLLRNERKRSAGLRAQLAAYAAHLALARSQADRALELLVADRSHWSADDVAFCADAGIDVEK